LKREGECGYKECTWIGNRMEDSYGVGGMTEYVKVTAAIIERDGRVLIGKRKAGRFAGRWEFPGGKVEPGETPESCLKRELQEELGIEARIGPMVLSTEHAYSHMSIELITYRVEVLTGEFCLRDHTEICWIAPEELGEYDFPEADRAVIEKLMAESRSKG
jgi:8-oxo-dGTP diphosphatase